MNRYIAHADTCVLYDNRVLHSDTHDYCDAVGFKNPDSLGDFDIVNLEYKIILPHIYDVDKLIFKVNVDIDDTKTRKHIITVKTYVNMKKVADNEYEKDLPIYKANLKILVPIVKGEF